MLHVPFKGTGEAMAGLISGDVDLTFSSTGSALPQVQGGKLTLLAMCTPRRLAKLPDAPRRSPRRARPRNSRDSGRSRS